MCVQTPAREIKSDLSDTNLIAGLMAIARSQRDYSR
jgi:hypothetical protein